MLDTVSVQTFNLTLTKPIYAGIVKVKGWNEEHRGNFDAIVSLELFQAVQAMLKGKRRSITPYQRNNPNFPLRRFVTCGKCGTPLTDSASKGRKFHYAYYHCRKATCKAVRISKETFESGFLKYLDSLTPRLEYLRLFNEVVLATWKQKQQLVGEGRISLEKALRSLKERRGNVVEAFIHRQVIDKATYDEQKDKLDEEIALKEIELNEQRLEEFDLEGVLNFAQYLMEHLGRLWLELPLDQKQRLQKVLFPSGVSFVDGEFGTAELALVFKALQPSEAPNSKLATPTRFELVLPP